MIDLRNPHPDRGRGPLASQRTLAQPIHPPQKIRILKSGKAVRFDEVAFADLEEAMRFRYPSSAKKATGTLQITSAAAGERTGGRGATDIRRLAEEETGTLAKILSAIGQGERRGTRLFAEAGKLLSQSRPAQER